MSLGIRLGSLSSEVTRPRSRREVDSQWLTGFYSMKKSEWEETQGNGAKLGPGLEPAVQRSAL